MSRPIAVSPTRGLCALGCDGRPRRSRTADGHVRSVAFAIPRWAYEVVDTRGFEPPSAGCKPAALPIELRARDDGARPRSRTEFTGFAALHIAVLTGALTVERTAGLEPAGRGPRHAFCAWWGGRQETGSLRSWPLDDVRDRAPPEAWQNQHWPSEAKPYGLGRSLAGVPTGTRTPISAFVALCPDSVERWEHIVGASDGSRTRIVGLEGRCATTYATLAFHTWRDRTESNRLGASVGGSPVAMTSDPHIRLSKNIDRSGVADRI